MFSLIDLSAWEKQFTCSFIAQLRRIAPFASSSEKPIELKTWEMFSFLSEQAEPVVT